MRWKVTLPLATIVMTAACASAGQRAGAPASQWPKADAAERDVSVEAIYTDSRTAPSKLWLISSPDPSGERRAVEFFTGEQVRTVEAMSVAADNQNPPGIQSYSFTDASGHRYSSVRADITAVDPAHPEIYAGWEANGHGHDVYLGGYLFEQKGASSPGQVYKSAVVAIDPANYFGNERACDRVAYVARTQGSNDLAAAADFVPRTRILADFDKAKGCWNTRPTHAVDLQDNTFLMATATRVFRMNSFDLTPAGTAPDLKVIDITEK